MTHGRLKVLTQREARTVRALAETMFPPGQGVDVTPEEARVVEYIDEILSEAEPQDRVMMRAMFTLFELQSLVTSPFRPSLFSRASSEVREKTLAGWDTSRLYPRRLAFMALRSLMMWAYVDNPVVEQAVGIERGTTVIDRLKAEGWSITREDVVRARNAAAAAATS